jgi:membrane carboxypeptidase/penicillin-binding protein
VVERGTASAARTLGVEEAVAGKTGTSNDGRDGWFVGYTPALVSLVWVGFDEPEPTGLSGAQLALPIWADFARRASRVVPSGPFEPPDSITFRDIDPTTGKLATAFCPLTVREAFLTSTEPRERCPHHDVRQVVRHLLRELFGARPGPAGDGRGDRPPPPLPER